MTEEFIKYILVERRYSSLTARNYRNDISEFLRYLEIPDDDFDSAKHLTASTVRGWILCLSESKKSGPSTINRKVSSLRSLYKWLRRSGMASKDPFVGIGALRTPKRLPSFVPKSVILKALYNDQNETEKDFTNRKNSLIILLFYSTGIRLAELMGIKLSDFSADMSELKIRGKGDKERMVPVIEDIRGDISDYICVMKSENICDSEESLLFLTDKGEPVSRTEVYNVVRNWLRSAGIQGKVSPHVLRHTFATHILNEGADMREIQELLGHSSLSATEIYTHNSIAKLKEVYTNAHPRAGKK